MKKIIYLIPLLVYCILPAGCSSPNDPANIDPVNKTSSYETVFDLTIDFPQAEWSESSKIIKLRDGNYIVGGRTSRNVNSSFMLKINNEGKEIWKYIYIEGKRITSILEDSDNNIIAYGDNGDNLFVYKTDPNGSLIWKQYLYYKYCGNVIKVAENSKGEYIVATNSYAVNTDCRIYKLNNDGSVIWEHIIETDSDSRSIISSLFLNARDQIEILGLTEKYEQSIVGWFLTLDNGGNFVSSIDFDEEVSEMRYMNNIIKNDEGQLIGCSGNRLFSIDQRKHSIVEYEVNPIHGYNYLHFRSISTSNNGSYLLAGSLTKQWREKIGPNEYLIHTDDYSALLNISTTGNILWAVDISNELKLTSSYSVVINDMNELISAGYKVLPNEKNPKVWIKKIKIKNTY